MIPRPLPRVAAFEKLAFGMFVHWGLYSQLGRGEWVQHFEKIPRDDYLKLMETFTAEDFDGRTLARVAKRAGMKYVTMTSRHHEGFSLYDTRGLSKLDVTHTPCGRDLVEDFVEGCRTEGIVPMLYCTTLDWNDVRFKDDWGAYLKYLRDSIEILCTRYGPIGGFWFDGNWSRPDANWQESELYETIRRYQPDTMIINNTGVDARGRAGHVEIDCVTFERGRAEPLQQEDAPKFLAAEMCHTMNYHWGRAHHDFNHLSPANVIEELCLARRAGANLLLNVGPMAEGGLPEYEAAALARAGEWIDLHGGSEGVIYAGTPCGVQGSGEDFGLATSDALYLFVTNITPTSDTRYVPGLQGTGPRVFDGIRQTVGSAVWLDDGTPVEWGQDPETERLTITVPEYPYGSNTVVRVAKLN